MKKIFSPRLKIFVRSTRYITINAAMSESDSDEDALVDDVYAYLGQKSYPKGCSGTRKRQIRKRAERFLSEGRHATYTTAVRKEINRYKHTH